MYNVTDKYKELIQNDGYIDKKLTDSKEHKKIKWKDFQIADLQPNLIPNGWDSFEPYGMHTKNYVKSPEFEDMKEWNNYPKEDGKVIIGRGWDLKQFNPIPKGKYNVSVLARLVGDIETKFRIDVYDSGDLFTVHMSDWIKSNEWEVYNFTIETEKDIVRSTFYSDVDGSKLELSWVAIVPINETPMLVRKTPLGNGLTRIQTWGGSNDIRLKVDSPTKSKLMNTSGYFENVGETPFRVRNYRVNQVSDTLEQGKSLFVNMTGEMMWDVPTIMQIRTAVELKGKPLDFIASDPQIVEGDKHNPALIVSELDNGQEHVQVYGAYPDTKLIYKGDRAFKGQPYTLKSTIDNKGLDLQLSSNIADNKDISKGVTEVNQEGTLKGDNIEIQLGVK